nr:hypothetical protein [Pantoea cypripedii]
MPHQGSPEYRSNTLGLKVKAVDKPGIIPARNGESTAPDMWPAPV